MQRRAIRTTPWRFALLLVIAVLGALPGCIGASPTPEPVTISFAYPRFDAEAYQRWVEQFNERYPYITVELQPRRSDPFGGLNPGTADTFINSQFALSSLLGNILDLTPLIQQDASFKIDDFYPGTLSIYRRKGKTWAVPANIDMMVMYYNKDLLDQAEVRYPTNGWTWDDFLSTASTLRDPDADIYGYGPTLDAFDALTFIYQHGGRIFDDLENPRRTTFDDPRTVEALDWYVRLFYDYNIAPTPEQMQQSFSGGDIRSGVHQNRIAMWSGMLSERGGRLERSKWEMNWGVVTLPREARSASLTILDGYYISANTQHPDACWKWISFLSQQLPVRQTPVRRSLVESQEYEREVGKEIATVVRASMEDALILSPRLAEFEGAIEIFGEAHAALLAGQMTPEEAMTWAQSRSGFK